MNRIVRCLLCCATVLICLSLFESNPASGHQPRLIRGDTLVAIEQPQISKAYYGELQGKPALFTFRTEVPFHLYVGLHAPDIPGAETDFSADIYRNGDLFMTLDGTQHVWGRFFEPYGGDSYLEGPECRGGAASGTYEIRVYSPDNRGKYVLAVGERESFPPGEAVRTLLLLPELKRDYFGKPAWTAYWNRSGLFMLPFLAAVIVLLALAARFAHRRKAGRRT
jgi:hypothetical protein